MTTNLYRLNPVRTSFFGFDRLFDELDRAIGNTAAQYAFPPYTLVKSKDGAYTIEMALAGYSKDEIVVEHDKSNGWLVIRNRVEVDEQERPGEVIRDNVKKVNFAKKFTVSELYHVDSASMKDGLLKIVLRETSKPNIVQQIAIE